MTSLDRRQGGIAAVNHNLVRAFRCISREGRRVHARALVYHGRGLHVSPAAPEDPIQLRMEGCRSSRWRFLVRYASLCVRWRPTLVLIDHLHLAVVPYLWGWLVRAPLVLFCHGVEFDGRVTRLRQRAFRSVNLRLSNSRFTADRLMTLLPGTPVEACELGLGELPCQTPAQEEVLLPDAFGHPRKLGNRFVLIVSRLSSAERYKGHDQLIGILPSILASIPAAQLVVAGEGDDRGRLTALARGSGAGQAMLFTGFAPPELLAALFARCRLFAMPSRGEGFGLVYLEAMRFGKPCIASRVDGGSEVVVDGVTGLHVDPGNLAELRAAVTRLLRDDGLAEKLGRAGLERLNRHYRFEHFRHRLQERLSRIAPALAAGGRAAVEEVECPLPRR